MKTLFEEIVKKGYQVHNKRVLGDSKHTSEETKTKDAIQELALVVMWLYEKYGIWINVWSDTNLNLSEYKDKAKWFYVINCDLLNCYDDKGKNKQLLNSPTDAYQAAIEYTLKNLI